MKLPIDVAHVTTAHPHTDNRIFRKECVALRDAGITLSLIAVAANDVIVDGIPIIALPARRGRIRRMVVGPFDALRALRRANPAMIHVHDPELIPLAIFWRAIHRRPAIYDAHEDLPKQVSSKPYIPKLLRPAIGAGAHILEQAAGSLLDGVVAATPAIAEKYPPHSTVLVQNFPWLASFPAPSPLQEENRDILYVGAITMDRGLHEMLAVASQLPADSDLLLVGQASPDAAISLNRHVSKRVNYLGVRAPDELPSLLDSARVGLAILKPLPNYLKSQSTKIYEYMAAARPFVASNFPYWKDQLEQFNCGIFLDPNDGPALAAAIGQLLEDTQQSRDMGLRGRRALEQHFTFEVEAKRLIGITTCLLDEQNRRRSRTDVGTRDCHTEYKVSRTP